VFLPERYKVKDFGGDAIATNLLPPASLDVSGAEEGNVALGMVTGGHVTNYESMSLLPGQLGGIVVDPNGAVVANARVTVTQMETGAVRNVMTDSSGRWVVSNLSSGQVKITVSSPGFNPYFSQMSYDGSRPVAGVYPLSLGGALQSVEVTGNAQSIAEYRRNERAERDAAKKLAQQQQLAASANVTNLQQRISGILPVRVDVPHAGNSYHFVRPLVLDEETKVTFTYRSK